MITLLSKLNKRLIVEQLQRMPDGRGSWTESWTEVGQVWASVNPVSSRERLQYQQMKRDVSHRIYVRYSDDFGGDVRFRLGTRIFVPVEPLNPSERSKLLEILAIEVVS